MKKALSATAQKLNVSLALTRVAPIVVPEIKHQEQKTTTKINN